MANNLLKPIEQLVQRPIRCSCKKTHRTDVKTVVIERGALDRLPDILADYKDKHILVISDRNTERAAGNKVVTVLGAKGFNISEYVFDHDVVPDWADLGMLTLAIPNSVELLVAAGSGALHDVVKYVSYKSGIPLVSLPTAASTDIYAMPYSVFYENGKKHLLESVVPPTIVVDLDVIAAAPKNMAPAGAAAVLSKYISIFDWKLSKIIDETPYCENTAEAMLENIGDFVESMSGSRPLYSVNTLEMLMRALLFCGMMVSFAGSLYPACGSETLIAECICMTGMYNKREITSEEFVKAVAVANCVRIAESITGGRPNFEMAKTLLDDYGWVMHNNEITRVYKEDAAEVLARQGGDNRYNKENHQRRLFLIADRWNEIVASVEEMVPDYTVFREVLRSCMLPYRFEDLGMTRGQALDAILWSGELSDRYNLLSLIWEVGEIDSVANALTARMRD